MTIGTFPKATDNLPYTSTSTYSSLRAEVVQLRLTKPAPGERKVAHNIPPPPPTQPPHAPSSPPPLAIDDEIINSSAGEGNTVEEPPHPSLTAPVSLEDDSDTKEDDDSQQPVGHNAEDQDMMDENDEEPVQQPAEDLATSTRVTAMFQRLLSMSRPTGQLTIAPDGSPAPPPPPPAPTITPSASKPSAILNGRLICNLPDHPIHAGATAIVAVLLGDQLTVANAGDSRGVLCRSGRAIPLSFDHKPQDDTELDRIRKAGGFVNQFGRVNGNLNLSRSIGDLKYKQVPGIAKADQMITAEPDIMVQTITDEDEFVILGCDGIWDCLSNEQAVDYVRQRLDDQSPTSIGAEMLSYIISDDPRMSQGIGGDNMTVMIIDLQPSNRNSTMDDDDDEEQTEASTPPDSTD